MSFNFRLKHKIVLIPVLASILFLLIFIVSMIFNNHNNKLLTKLETGYVAALEMSRDLEKTLMSIQYSLQNAASSTDHDEMATADSLANKFLVILEKGKAIKNLRVSDIEELKIKFQNYYTYAKDVTSKIMQDEFGEKTIKDLEVMQGTYNDIKNKLITDTMLNKSRMNSIFNETRRNYKKTGYIIGSLIVLIIFLFITLSLFFVKSIITPLNKVVHSANQLALGDTDVSIHYHSNDEIGELSRAFTTLCNVTNELANAANAIGKGDYNVHVIKRSEKDTLGKALLTMKNNLVTISNENERQSWSKTGQSELNIKMRGEQELVSLAHNIVTFLAPYLNAQVGTLYLMTPGKVLKLTATYAFTKRKKLSLEFKVGEGLVGQAALEKQPIILSNIPDDYIRINSGLGDTVPRNIIVLPLLYENEVKGVLELGSIHEFTAEQLNFLGQVNENIAISINSAQARIQMRELLIKTQQQAEELQSQQEELRQINEELESQAKSLKESQSRLQKQQEELQQTNQELEEKTDALEKQKTDIRQKNIELEKTKRLLEEKANDLEMTSKYKSEFLANMSHELRTPLNSMLILSKLLLENQEKNLTEKQIEFARTINSAGNDLLNLINEILDISKVEAGKIDINIDEVNLSDFASSLKRNFEHIAKQKNLKFEIMIDEKLPTYISTDGKRLDQIVKNFLSNAFKFTGDGKVALNIYQPINETEKFNGHLVPEKTIAFAIADSGKGIAKDKQKLIFEAFQQEDGTTNRKYGGTGLGLSISKELTKILGGQIHLESEVNKGSTFTLFLPYELTKNSFNLDNSNTVVIRTADAGNREKKKDEQEKPKSKSFGTKKLIPDDRSTINSYDKTLLIIEDDITFSKILYEHGKSKDFKCLIAPDGETGLKMAAAYNPKAIILDINLPGIDGWKVIENIKDNPATRHIPVHFISGSEFQKDAYKKGAIGFLKKPINIEDLNAAFKKFETLISRDIKKLLFIENDAEHQQSIVNMMGTGDIEITTLKSGERAYSLLKQENFDCLVMDLSLEDMTGHDLLTKIRNDESIPHIPIIVYTNKELSKGDIDELQELAESIIIKGAKSKEKLLDETTLFLHRVESNLPKDVQKMLRLIHNKEKIFQNKKILVVDDDMRNVFALTSILEEKKMQVYVAKDGIQGLKCLENEPGIDLVLMDIMMPEMDGYETMRRIRQMKNFKNLPIIALTARAMKGDRNRCIEAGASDYLSKPVDMDKLLSLLRVWLYQ